MSTWYFVRHGQSIANRDGWLAGWVDARLSPLGVDQCQRLQHQIKMLSIQQVYASDLSRAYRTAQIITANQPIEVQQVSFLRERSMGIWEGRTRKEAFSNGRRTLFLSWTGCPQDGENRHQVAQRILHGLVELKSTGNTLLVAHGTALGCILGLLDETPLDQIGYNPMPNATLFSREVAPNTWQRLLAQLTKGENHGQA